MLLRLILSLTIAFATAALAYWLSATALEAGGGGGGGGCGAEQRAGAGTRVELTSSCFSPAVLYAPVGATVEWANVDATPHNVVPLLGDVSWSKGEERNIILLNRNEVASTTFGQKGIYPYFCSYHPGMLGVIVVGDTADSRLAAGGFNLQSDGMRSVARSGQGSMRMTPPAATEATGSGLTELQQEEGLSPLLAATAGFAVGLVATGGVLTLARRRSS